MYTLETLASILAVGAIYVLTPVGLSVFADFRKPREVTCPENANPAQVSVDARYAAMTSVIGAQRVRLTQCSRWPDRAGCDRACTKQLS
jgi:hypothetical protein